MTAPSRVSSRLVKTERKRLLRQTLVLGGVSILLLLLFVFVVLPGFIRIVNRFLDQPVWQQVDEIPPQVPQLAAPPAATNSARLVLTGYGEPESDLVVLVNNSRVAKEEITDEGDFEVIIQLEEGENRISTYAVDAAGNESALSREYIILLITTPPSLEINSPEEGKQFEGRQEQEITLEGTTDEQVRVYVNNRLTFPDEEGRFRQTVRLEEGENKIEIKAEDRAGNVTELELIVHFRL
jgi:hypothetical protein